HRPTGVGAGATGVTQRVTGRRRRKTPLMGLTSKLFFTTLAVTAVATAVGTLWLWPRAAGKGHAAWLGRLGMLAATQLSVTAVLLAAANDTYGFYSSWNDLLGQAEGRQTLEEPTAADGRPVTLTVTGIMPDSRLKGGKESAGLVEAVTFHGAVSGLTTDGYVYLPPQYFAKGHEHDRFPVV